MAKFSQQFLANLGRPAMTQGMFNLGATIGGIPAAARAKKMEEERRKQLAGLDPSTVQGLQGLAKYYQTQGDMENAVKYATASGQLQNQQAEQQRLVAFQEQVATAAEAAGLTNQAATARATQDMDELRAINNDIREFQIEQLPLDNPQVIKARLKMAGFTPAQITAMGPLSAEDADALLKGRTGKLEAWQDAEGKIQAVNVNDFGLVYNDQTNTYVKASELGLVRKAPNVIQQVVDTSQQVGAEEMAKANVKEFVEFNEKARGARDMIDLIDRQTARLEGGMPTGILATTELTLRRVGEALGMPYDPQVDRAETFIAEAATLVRNNIKDFGSGSGLSDADREYAKIEQGADITQQQEALLNLLKIRRGAMVDTIESFNKVRNATAKRLGENNMTTFMPITMPEEPQEAELLLEPGFVMDQ
jgi:hypothetical protein